MYIEPAAARARRFQPITVGEPTEEQALAILRALRPRYESHHRLKISDEALAAAVTLSRRYITGRFLPDKAVDLMDEAASRVRMGTRPDSPELRAMEAKAAAAGKAEDRRRGGRSRGGLRLDGRARHAPDGG